MLVLIAGMIWFVPLMPNLSAALIHVKPRMPIDEINFMPYMLRMKYITYIRPTVRRSAALQAKQLELVESWQRIEDGDDGNTLADAIKMIRSGRALAVAEMGDLGSTVQDRMAIVSQVHERGGHILEAVSGRTTLDPVHAVELGARIRKTNHMTPERAREMATKWTDRQLEIARRLWVKPKLTGAEVAERSGIPLVTLYRRLGKRGTPTGPRPKT